MPMKVIEIEWDGQDARTVLFGAFKRMELMDHIAGIVYATPIMMKTIVMAMPDEVEFDYIPEGIGRLHTAYLKYRPLPTDREIRISSTDGELVFRITSI